jgi:hypothetical protein
MADINSEFSQAHLEAITETVKYEDGKNHHTRTQDVSRILDHNAHMRENHTKPYYGDAAFRLVGTLPLVVAEQWATETKTKVGTKEFLDVVRKKLADPDNARLVVKGF